MEPYIMKRKYKLSSVVEHLSCYPVRFIPLSKFKHEFCLKILNSRNSLPLYLAIYPGNTVVQVGTPNIVTLKRLSRLVGKKGTVVIIEAEPSNCIRLNEYIGEKRLQNVRVVQKGAWSERTTLTLSKSDHFDGDHKLDNPAIKMDNDYRTTYSSSIEIEVDKVDNILSEIGVNAINYISITVNGAEFEVIKGCKAIISKSTNLNLYSKGHARKDDPITGEPINSDIRACLVDWGMDAVITHGERSSSGVDSWEMREGDVFAWKTESGFIHSGNE